MRALSLLLFALVPAIGADAQILTPILVGTVSAAAAPALIDHAASGGCTSGTISTPTSTTTLRVLAVSSYTGDASSATVTSTQGAIAWQSVTRQFTGDPGNNIMLWYTFAASTASTDSVTIAGGGTPPTFCGMVYASFSGTKTSGDPIDQQNGASPGTSISSLQPGSITPAANALVLSALGLEYPNGSGSFAASGMTLVDAEPTVLGINVASAMAWSVAAGAINPTWTAAGWSGAKASATIASFLSQ